MRATKAIQRWLGMAAAMMVVAGCGGGSDPEAAQPAPIQLASSVVSAGTAVPSATVAAVAQTLTPYGSASLGSAVPVPDKESVVLAVDAQGQIRLAGFSAGGQATQLTAESTAVALVRLAVARPDHVTAADLNTHIRSAASFASLVSQVESSLASGTPFTSSPELLRTVLSVARDAAQMVSTPQALTLATAVTSTSVESPPYTIIDSPLMGEVRIDAERVLENSTAVAWSVKSATYSGQPIGAAALLDAPAGLFSRQYLPKRLELAGDDGRTFRLTVGQDAESRSKNMRGILVDLIAEMVKDIANSECAASLVDAAIGANDLRELVSGSDINGVVGFLESQAAKAIGNASVQSQFASGCLKNAKLEQFVAAKLGYLVPLFKAIDTVSSTASIVERLAVLGHFWDDSKEVVVCIGKNGSVANCVTRFRLVPDNFYMIVGDTYSAELKAFDTYDDETLVPSTVEIAADLAISASPTGVGTLVPAAGRWSMSIRDTVTQAKTEQTVELINPVFEFPELSLEAGQSRRVALVDPAGRELQVHGSALDFSYTSSDPSVVEVVRDFSKLAVWVKMKQGGEATVTAKNVVTGHEVTLKVMQPVACSAEVKAQYRAAVVGMWSVGQPGSTPYDLELFADGTGVYRVGGTEYRMSWTIASWDEPMPSPWSNSYSPMRPLGVTPGCVLYDSGFWHYAYDGPVRSNLQLPVTGFEKYPLGGVSGWPASGNYFGYDLSTLAPSIIYRKR